MSRSVPATTTNITVTRMAIVPTRQSIPRTFAAAMPLADAVTCTDWARATITKKCRAHAGCGYREGRGFMGRVLQSWVAAPAAAGIAALLVTAPARAELTGVAEAGVGYSDNIGRVPSNETDETIGTVGLELDWSERTRRIRGDATVDLSYYEYMDDTFDSEVLGTANGTLALAIVPETFQWVFQDSFGQAQSDPFAPASPTTREDLNYFSTGPDLTVRFGSTGFGRVFGRWSQTSYERSPLDAERTSGGVAVG